jgi:hypothetical protein
MRTHMAISTANGGTSGRPREHPVPAPDLGAEQRPARSLVAVPDLVVESARS